MPGYPKKNGLFTPVSHCRICKSEKLVSFLDFGTLPLTNSFVKTKQEPVVSFPLNVLFCTDCSLIQLGGVVEPAVLFSGYLYQSSLSKTFQSHCSELVDNVCESFPELNNGRVLDIGSNDGCLLDAFKKRGFETIGVEPAAKPAQIARQKGIQTIENYWNDYSLKHVLKKGNVQVVTATSVLAHVFDLHSFVQRCATVLAPNGVLVLEVHYAAHLIQKNEFDTIGHENQSYFLLKPLLRLFGDHHLKIIDVQTSLVHGDAIRLSIVHVKNPLPVRLSVSKLLKKEKQSGLYRPVTYLKYRQSVQKIRKKTIGFLKLQHKSKKIVAGFGAAAKASLILNFFGIGSDWVRFVVDQTPQKQGRFIGGTDIAVVGMDALKNQPVDFLIVFSWNYASEIMQKTRFFSETGGQFVLLVPSFKIVRGVEDS